jgi:hypothetical protein
VLALGYPGGTYERVFVADVELLAGSPTTSCVALDDAYFLAVFPMKGENVARIIGTVRLESEEHHEKLTWNDVSTSAIEHMQVKIDRVNWFSTYRVHHRVAEQFRRGRAFLVGDAAHIHSPVGGQGMNTGIGDAVNLAWKLAAVIQRRAGDGVLRSYETERIAFARRLVATTDRVFTFATRDGFIARRVRLDAVPRIVPALMNRTAVRRFCIRTVSQTLLDYRRGELSEGKAGSVRGVIVSPGSARERIGRRQLRTAHVTRLAAARVRRGVSELATTCSHLGCRTRSRGAHPRRRAAGLEQDAAYLVRPDGYGAG